MPHRDTCLQGKAPSIFKNTVEPILKAAQCTIDVVCECREFHPGYGSHFITLDTDHSKHAQEIAKELPLDYDAVVILSGDGLAHEIFNGFAEHSDPMRAFAIPLAPIPSGSANGTCLSLLGVQVY